MKKKITPPPLPSFVCRQQQVPAKACPTGLPKLMANHFFLKKRNKRAGPRCPPTQFKQQLAHEPSHARTHIRQVELGSACQYDELR